MNVSDDRFTKVSREVILLLNAVVVVYVGFEVVGDELMSKTKRKCSPLP